jgi:hypothetical protein
MAIRAHYFTLGGFLQDGSSALHLDYLPQFHPAHVIKIHLTVMEPSLAVSTGHVFQFDD